MIIWILDCATCYCTKVHLSDERQKELENKFGDSVEDFLYAHEKELGINLNYSSWMITDEEQFEVMEF